MKLLPSVPATIGLTAFAAVLATGFLLPGSSAAVATDRPEPASIPSRLPDYSYLTGPVTGSAPGRAIAIYQHGFGVEFLDFPQAVMVGADGDLTRRINLAEDRGGAETQGDPGPMLLSPDGTTVAVGRYDTASPDLALLDLATGEVRSYAVEGGRSAVPIAWSPDSLRVAYLTTEQAANPHNFAMHVVGTLGMLDLDSARSQLLPGSEDVWSAAFSPDGTELAVQRPGLLEVVDRDGDRLRELDSAPGRRLDGPNAWSPDGALIATTGRAPRCFDQDNPFDYAAEYACLEADDLTFFVDATGRGTDVPDALSAATSGSYGVLGWTGDREVLVLDDLTARHNPEDDNVLYGLTALPLDGGEARRISAVDGDSNFGVGQFQLAVGLLADLHVRDAGTLDRGRWPTPFIGGAAVLAGGATFLVTGGVVRRLRRSATTEAGGPGHADDGFRPTALDRTGPRRRTTGRR